MRITKGCTLTDGQVLNNRDLAYLTGCAGITYLASFYKYRNGAYVETWVDGHPISAFVPVRQKRDMDAFGRTPYLSFFSYY